MSQEQFQQFLDQAQQSLQSGQFQSALELVDQAIALDPNSSDAHVLRGVALSQLSRADEATAAFREAIMHGAYNSKAYYNLAVHYFQLGEKLKAEEMAKETLKLETNHGGARQLLNSIAAEREAQKPATPAYNPGDPLSTPPPEAARPESGHGPFSPEERPATGPGYGPSQPSQPVQPPSPSGYYRQGYETSHVHSVTMVANLGKTWDTIGWLIALANLVVVVVSWAMQWNEMMQMFSNPQAANQNPWASLQGGNLVVTLFSLVVHACAMTWMIMELADRRGNWLWLLPYFLCCCCCGFPAPVIAVYLWKGRS